MTDYDAFRSKLRDLLADRPHTMPEIEKALGVQMSNPDDQRRFSRACRELQVKWDPDLQGYVMPKYRTGRRR